MSDAIACPSCLKRFKWTPRIAGKRVTCHCGQKFVAPEAPGGAVVPVYETGAKKPEPKQEDDTYELNFDDPAEDAPKRKAQHAGATKCPDCNAPVNPGAVVCVRCGYNLAAGEKIKTAVGAAPAEDDGDARAPVQDSADLPPSAMSSRSRLDAGIAEDMAKQHRFRNVILPTVYVSLGVVLILLCGLVVAPIAQSGLIFGGGGGGRLQIFGALMLQLAERLGLLLVLLFIAIVIAARLFGTSFGGLGEAVFKLIALVLFVGAVDLTTGLGMVVLLKEFAFAGFLLTFAILIATFLIVVYSLFDEIEIEEVMVMALFMIVGPIAYDAVVRPIIAGMFA